jgi:hypothetical protein
MNRQEFNQATFVNIMLVLLVLGVWILVAALLFAFYVFMGEM